MKKLLAILVLIWAGAAAGIWYYHDTQSSRVGYRTVKVRRGDLQATINATGTIEPEEVVDVGSQVAAAIESFGPDPRDPARPISYGSHVEQGTLLAKLDAALYVARVDQARASLTRAEADVEQAQAKLRQAERELDRARRIQAKGTGLIAEQECDAALANLEGSRAALSVARSAVAVAKANLEEANVNLGYTTIRSPVQGVILDRRVNVGQTVVASLNAPSLFLIAKDLRRMEIWASVNETDIGAIHVGQPVAFTVGAFPREQFRGKVAQVRLNASMVQSVVTYTVVVEVDNAAGKLLPYLTARLQFEVERRTHCLLVPNAALRWRPRPEQIAPEFRAEAEMLTQRRSLNATGDPATAPTSEATLWVRRGDLVAPIVVQAGLSDGSQSEVRGEGLAAGLEVVIGATRREVLDDISTILPHTQRKEKTE